MLKRKEETGSAVFNLQPLAGNTFFCVAIGFSSGGFDALKELIAGLPNTLSTVSFFVAQPLEADQFNKLVTILPPGSPLSIKRAEHLECIKPGIIYTVTPFESMELTAAGLIKTLPSQSFAGICCDVLFQSMAIFSGENSIAIVLSGIGSDGAAGIKFIQQANGKVLVQTPQSAHYNGMPQAAIATKCVHKILPVYEMGNALLQIFLQYTAGQSQHTYNGLHIEGNKKTDNSGKYINLIQSASHHSQNPAVVKNNIATIVKDTIFNSCHHTYIVIDNENVITEVNGDTDLYFNTSNSSCINQKFWLVLNEVFEHKVQSAFAKALSGQTLPAETVKAIVLKGRLIFIRILVKIIKTCDSKVCNSILILEKIETDQIINNNISAANKTANDVVMQNFVEKLQPAHYRS